ncbi:MAG: T9SS type A sorting domain-containing protein [Saprospiraceae bacterium]|nr:T9SS type A sorting domain-containing protein [Saprospiraceae bacterium]
MGEITNDFLGNEYYYYFYNWKVQKPSVECVSERVAVTVGVSANGEVLNANKNVTISPNPTSSNVVVTVKVKAEMLRVFDATGKEVYRMEIVGNESVPVDFDGQAAGVYLLMVETEQGPSVNRVVVGR